MKFTREQIREKKKESILTVIEKYNTVSTSFISSKIKADKYRATELLEELLKEKKVRMIKLPNVTYWEVK